MTPSLKPGIDFCICTFNRVDFLGQCIESLLPQMIPGQTMITVVDNNSNDGTQEFIRQLMTEHTSVRYFYENKQGLSNARNKGWMESEYEWIFYVDDDCVPPPSLVREALDIIENHSEFDAIGGPIEALYMDKPPEWLDKSFGSFSIPTDKVIRVDKGYVRGGCFLVKKKVLSELNGFNPNLGMTGKTLQYADELEFQSRMRKSSYKIGYAPSLRMPHYVRTEKISVGWLVHSEYAKQRDKMVFDPVNFPLATLHLIRTMVGRIAWTPVYLFKLLSKKNYTRQNLVLDEILPLAYRTGEWVGSFKHILR